MKPILVSVLELNAHFTLHYIYIVHYHLKEDPLQQDQGMSTNLVYNNYLELAVYMHVCPCWYIPEW